MRVAGASPESVEPGEATQVVRLPLAGWQRIAETALRELPPVLKSVVQMMILEKPDAFLEELRQQSDLTVRQTAQIAEFQSATAYSVEVAAGFDESVRLASIELSLAQSQVLDKPKSGPRGNSWNEQLTVQCQERYTVESLS